MIEILNTIQIPLSKLVSNNGQIDGIPKNPRFIKDYRYQKLVKSIQDNPEFLGARELIVHEYNGKYVVLCGNMRYRAAKELQFDTLPAKVIPDTFTTEQIKAIIIKDNISFGDDDFDALANEWDALDLADWGFEFPDLGEDFEHEILEAEDFIDDKDIIAHNKLKDIFIVPPFTILDTRQGYWNERKSYWKTLIKDNGESREDTLAKGSIMSALNNGVSILDPVLAEIINKWFGLPKCKTFDCFAGDSVFGYVSSYLENSFTGIELRKEQADLNNSRIKGFNSKYICDDGQNILKHIDINSQDLLFSCPPYFDLEVYSDLPNDASNQNDYIDFIKILDNAFTDAIKCLKENRFAVITVGDVRDKNGFYYRFVDDIKDIFKKSGVLLYNELILVESIGTLPQRVGRFMEHRKIGKCHQNVLVFYKGNPKNIKNIYPKLNFSELENTNNNES